jgi:hypothetical protein
VQGRQQLPTLTSVALRRLAAAGLRALRRPAVAACTAGLVLGVLAGEARAAAPSEADTDFERGRQLMAAGHTAEACAKFDRSYHLDPATGTLLNLAVCNAALGKTATAWAQFDAAEKAAQSDGRSDRVKFAREQRAKLAPRLVHLSLIVPAQHPSGLELYLDGAVLGEDRWNVAIPIDPGQHTVLAEAPNRTAHAFPVRVPAQAETVSLVIDVGATPAAADDRRAPPAPAPQARSAEPPSRPLRTLAYVSGGLSAVSLGVGLGFGARAFSRWEERNRRCPLDTCSTEAGARAQRSAENAARYANLFGGIGLVALASGIGLYFLSDTDEASPASLGHSVAWAPAVARDHIGFVAEGRW